MKIAQIAPLVERVPPKKYGGTERFISTLTEGLVKKGHEVTLFASGNSVTSAHLDTVSARNLREQGPKNPYGANFLTTLNIGNAYRRQKEFDILHDHNDFVSLTTAMLSSIPVVMTLHGAVTPDSKKMFEGLKGTANPYFVSISYSQRKPLPSLNYVSNIYHGINVSEYKFSGEHEGYLLFVGRITEEKGVKYAVDVAEFLDLPLILAAKVDSVNTEYFEKYVKPRLSEKIRWVGEVSSEQRNELMAKAMCFLHPVTWREPFGLTLIEAGACGTPVVAFNRGSIPEIIKHGKTGFIVEDESEMIEYVRRIKDIKRKSCRQHIEEKFNADRMVSEYESAYEKILAMNKQEKLNLKTQTMPLIKN